MKNEFDKIVRSRRSVRRFKKINIDEEDVKDCIYHASLAPNSWVLIHLIPMDWMML